MSLSGKVALVTGGSRGIGFATAKILSDNGASVAITGKDPDRLEESATKISNSFAIVADIRNSDQVKNAIEKTIEKFGRLDILVNNAGIFPRIKQLHEIEEDEWDEVLDVNLTGQFRVTKEAIPHLQKTSGSIINISSDAGLKAYQGFNADAYSATKAALIVLTKCWALEYSKDKIRVNCICPGVVDTDMTKPFVKTQKDRDFMDAEHPLGRMGKPEEVAKAVLYFASDDASWTTGAILAVDGGESTK
ncbi:MULTISPECIES: SDR family NAD(P)-dependent oxidoreductase [Nitrosopumilus]|uniref:3-oxoacyl-[acyl-carrier-protein] reductase FabG n=1 Tax=Nitrosopumilus piranensis TaxID=1582439 RepID=A0A0C5BX36_9ARCH|nr:MULTISPECIES: SDR family NAD(P)-dependent oxidoreductase [Nitrosopumilus]AJM91505.1 3-oxoacyl-[acyl-carrier-protein] reductase FabG [Nitrosopumilus piranensis]KAF6245970.1 short-chain dehydrogenase [Nitrosopumilus sp. b2]